MANMAFTAYFVHTAAARRATLVLQAAKLYHEVQTAVIERMSTYWVMIVIYSFIDFVPPPKKEPDNLFKEGETDQRPHNRANHAH
jgi:hypothetical protein